MVGLECSLCRRSCSLPRCLPVSVFASRTLLQVGPSSSLFFLKNNSETGGAHPDCSGRGRLCSYSNPSRFLCGSVCHRYSAHRSAESKCKASQCPLATAFSGLESKNRARLFSKSASYSDGL